MNLVQITFSNNLHFATGVQFVALHTSPFLSEKVCKNSEKALRLFGKISYTVNSKVEKFTKYWIYAWFTKLFKLDIIFVFYYLLMLFEDILSSTFGVKNIGFWIAIKETSILTIFCKF